MYNEKIKKHMLKAKRSLFELGGRDKNIKYHKISIHLIYPTTRGKKINNMGTEKKP